MSEIFPPPDYVQTKSAVPGIEIFMPAPEQQDEHREVVEFHCPQCGAATAYSAADGGLTCSHCGYYEAPQQEIVGKQADQFEFTVETMARAAQGWGQARKEMQCQGCGARTSLSPEDMTHTCAFCGSNQVIQREAPQDLLRPRYLIPFTIEAGDCSKIAREWLGSSWMTPGGLRKVSSQAQFTGLYLPYWTFDAVTTANWKAEVGHTETERYFSDGEWKTRTVIKWRWESGNVRLKIDDLLVEGTHRLSNLLLGRVNNYNLNALTPYQPEYLAGLQAQTYDVPLEQAWEQGRERMRERTRLACIDQASTSRVRNFSMNLDFSDESWRYVLMPVYLASYRYEGKVYQVMVNGQTGAIAGQRPVDWTKIWLVVAALLAPGVFLGLVGLVTLLFGGVGAAIGGLGFVLLVIGVAIAIYLLRQAQALDDA